MNRYPIQLAKVQPPSLRDETLARDRLLDWLNARIHDRVILVLADAGYGKTTLLADFARRTRLRTLWYRLEEDDRDWIAFLNHLVAAGREHDPNFAPTTASMLGDMSVGGPTRDAAIDVFMRELPAIAEHGAVLILDDFHLVDDSPDVRLMARELVAHAPERMSIVFASRRMPTIPLAKLRAAGEVAELGTDDLRFDATETGRLFVETYGRTLEPDVLADVVARTEGWAASLQLVQAALRDRTPVEIRRFVRGLSGADRELYDYLAEEVVGDLHAELQDFLMRTSILQTVTAELASVVVALDSVDTARLTHAAERLTLLSRRSRNSLAPKRYHPLVREFLEARLRNTAGDEAVSALHRRAAEAATAIDWRVAAHHFSQARDQDRVASVVAAAIPEIMGGGQYATAASFVEQIPLPARPPGLNLIASRMDLQRGFFESAEVRSTEVLREVRPGSSERDHALLNLLTIHFHAGRGDLAVELAEELWRTSGEENLRQIADGMKAMIAASADGRIDELPVRLNEMAAQQRGSQPHYFGVTMLNLAVTSLALDDPRLALDFARQAVEALEETSSLVEISAAVMAKATAMTMVGLGVEARLEIDRAKSLGQVEAILEHAELTDSFERPEIAASLLDSVDSHLSLTLNDRLSLAMQWARFSARRGLNAEARARADDIDKAIGGSEIGHTTARFITKAYVSVAAQSPEGRTLASEATQIAKRQGAGRWYRVGRLLQASTGSDIDLSSAIESIGPASPWNVTFVADLIAKRLDGLSVAALSLVGEAASLHPGRWRYVLRTEVDQFATGGGLTAARILETIGERPDILRLRTFARRQKRVGASITLGRSLARRLADKVYVEDQGRVSILIGQRQVPGSMVRRKVLALLCFLLTKPEMASTRDQALEALWPELDPLDAVNSLNQTVYFLRRILEQGYVDDLSPGYVHHDSDLLWLDRDLVESRSHECRNLIKDLPITPNPDQVAVLADKYVGRFALDFEYEEWAAPYRDWLHASYLEVVERAVASDFETGHFARGIRLARGVLDIDPNAEQVEVSLLHMYRASGAHAAAAEQYSHYAGVMRDQLGIEPPALENV